MKYVKILGLAAMAALALMAFGAGSASAATLLSTGATVPAETVIHAELEENSVAKLSTTDEKTLVDECKKSTVAGETMNTSGTTVTGFIGILSWAECTNTTHSDENAGGGGFGLLHINSAGTVTGSGSVVTVTFSGIVCKYGTGTGTHLGTLNTGTLAINAVINEQEVKKFICPDTTKWVAKYKVTSPHDLTAGA